MKIGILAGVDLSIAVYLLMLFNLTQADNDEICETESCNRTANKDLRFINRIADPCDDFYNYTCGFPLDNGENYGRDFDADVENQINRIQDTITRIDESNALAEYRNLKIYFDSCMKPEKNQNLPIFYNFLLQLGFKLQLEAGEWKQTGEFNWITTTQNVTRRGLINGFQTFLFSVKMKPSPIDSSKPIIVLRNSIPSRVANHRNIRKLHFDNDYAYIQKFLNNSNIQSEGIDIDKVRVDIFQKVFDFEEKLIEVVNFRDEEKADELMTIKNLSMIAPKIPWLSFIQSIVDTLSSKKMIAKIPWPSFIQSIVDTLSKKIVEETEIIAVESVEVMQKLEYLISNTSQNVLLTYIAYTTHMTYLRDVETERDFEFCLENNPLSNIMPMLLSQEVMTPEEKSKSEYIFQLTEKIYQAFVKIINDEWHWMEKSTKVQAIDKLKAMSIAVVYVDIPVFDYYFGFVLKSSDVYWSVLLQIKTLQLQRQIEMLPISLAVSRPVPSMSYEPIHLIDNMIYISLFGLRNYKIDNDHPDYLNFIKVGWDIAQMMSSAFIGQHQPSSSERILPWMNEPTKQKQNAIISCFVDQYSKFPGSETDIKYNNRDIMGQILSRNLGFEIVHRLFSNWANAPETPQWMLPNYNNTLDQMFFIVAGSQYCRQGVDDSLSPQYALQGIVQNFREFGDAFSCTTETEMNPTQKCRFSPEEVCYTQSCLDTAHTEIGSINRIADPCDDFYNYTCPSSKVNYAPFSLQYSVWNVDVKDSQNAFETIGPVEPYKPFQILKTYFTNYLEDANIKNRKSIWWVINKVLGFNVEWKADRWIQTREFDWITTTKKLANIGLLSGNQNFLFKISVKPSTIDSSKPMIVLRNAIHSRSNNHRNTRKNLCYTDSLYTDIFIEDIQFIEKHTDKFQADILQNAFDFEEKLIEILNFRNESGSEETITIQDLSTIAPEIPWLDFIQTIDSYISSFTMANKTEIISIESVKVMQELAKLIKNTPKNVLLTYIAYITHVSYMQQTMDAIRKSYLWSKHLHARRRHRAPWTYSYRFQLCADNDLFQEIMPMLLAAKVMTLEDKSKRTYILELSTKIKQAFLDIINDKWHWLDEPSKKEAIENIKSMTVEVVHKDLEVEMKKIGDYYQNFDMYEYSYSYWSILGQLQKLRFEHQIKMMPRLHDTLPKLLHMSHKPIQLINNTIFISLFGLRSYKIVNDRPDYLNFIKVGWNIAQTMASVLIDQPSPFFSETEQQSLRKSEKRQNSILRGFSQQHSKFFERLEMDPGQVKTIISRDIGLRIIYRVFENWVNITETFSWKLPNYNNTLNQMFFITAASQHCNFHDYDNISPSDMKILLGMVQTSPEFQEAFSCT